MKALDLFCGLGGWSDGLAAEGFDVTGVELVPMVARLYRHKVILADCCYLPLRDGLKWDLIVGSPPCRDFVKGSDKWWKIKKNPAHGVKLITAFLDYVKQAKPRYWLMENVWGATKYVRIKPRGNFKLSRTMYRPFWGNFPAFIVPVDYTKKTMKEISDGPHRKLRSVLKAKIPLPVARALGRAVSRSVSAWRPVEL